jgi:SAM-dependent methyltransferase
MQPELIERISSRLRPEHRASYRAERGQFVIKEFTTAEVKQDFLNATKDRMKRRFGRIYPTLIKLLSPVYGRDPVPRFLAATSPDALNVNLGSGTYSYPGVINADGAGYQNVHIVCDLEDLPFEDASVDNLVSIAVLEHVTDPARHVAEFLRVLKPGGQLLSFVPFLQPFHASPHDYQRYTRPGLVELFADFEVKVVKVGGGPTSALLWTLQEWLAMVLSLGSLRLYRLLIPVFWILSPLKFLDILLEKHPAAEVAASGFYLWAQKPADRAPAAT